MCKVKRFNGYYQVFFNLFQPLTADQSINIFKQKPKPTIIKAIMANNYVYLNNNSLSRLRD